MNTDSTRIVTIANTELIRPAPTWASVRAALSSEDAALDARSSSFPVTSYLSFRSRSRELSWIDWFRSATYSGRLLTSRTVCSISGTTSSTSTTSGTRTITKYTSAIAKPRLIRRSSTFTGPDAQAAMKAATTSHAMIVRSR